MKIAHAVHNDKKTAQSQVEKDIFSHQATFSNISLKPKAPLTLQIEQKDLQPITDIDLDQDLRKQLAAISQNQQKYLDYVMECQKNGIQ